MQLKHPADETVNLTLYTSGPVELTKEVVPVLPQEVGVLFQGAASRVYFIFSNLSVVAGKKEAV